MHECERNTQQPSTQHPAHSPQVSLAGAVLDVRHLARVLQQAASLWQQRGRTGEETGHGGSAPGILHAALSFGKAAQALAAC